MAGSDLVRALSRGLDVVQLVAHSQDGARLTDVARELGVKTTTVHNLVRTLIAHGFVEKGADRRLRLGSAVVELAQHYRERELLREAGEIMRQLSAAVPNAMVTFAEVCGAEVQPVLRLSPDRPSLLQTVRNERYSPYANASGLAVQATADEGLRADIRERYPFHEFGAHLWGDLPGLDRFLADVRASGYAIPPFDEQAALLRVAAPIRDRHGVTVGALGIRPLAAGRSLPAQRDQVVEQLCAAAAELNVRLSASISLEEGN